MTLSRSSVRLALLVPLSGFALAQQPEAPVMGYLVDQTAQRIRSVLGIPGAAQVGDIIELGVDIVSGAASARAGYVLALAGERREPVLWLPGAAAVRTLDRVPSGADHVYLSPEGSAAAFYYRAEKRVVVISGLPDALGAPVQFELGAMPPVATLAVSDDGQLIALGEAQGAPPAAAASVIILSQAGERNRFPALGGTTAFAFLPRSHAFLFTSAEQAWLIRGAGLSDERVRLEEQSLPGATAIAVDGVWALFAHATEGRVVLQNLSDLSIPAEVLDCGCQPGMLARMRGAVRLNDFRGSSLRLLDLTARPRVVFAAPPRDLLTTERRHD